MSAMTPILISLSATQPTSAYAVMVRSVKLGEIMRDVDGYWYFWPEITHERCGYWDKSILHWIANKLDELDKPYEEELDRYFSGEVPGETPAPHDRTANTETST